ncbi:MAG: nucleotide exchange factor GrpE [Pseudomonadota bacterium]|nr:nucleotide exchange factor GrpE [Pseudomonadota bacterium]
MIPVKGAGKAPEFEYEGEVMAKQQTKISAETAAQQNNDEAQNSPDQDMSVEELARENEQLKKSNAQLQQEKEALQERSLRLQADGENFRKRITREKEEFARYAKEEFIREILPIKDNLERALEHGGAGDNSKMIIDGINMILEQFSSIFEKMGVVCLTCYGEKFDPNFHEAMMHQEAAEHEPNTVIAEHQKGYIYHDRLLRPALVTVSKAQSKDKKFDNK